MSETSPPDRPGPAFPEVIRQFRENIGAVPQTLPRPSRTLPRLALKLQHRRKVVIGLYLLTLAIAGLYFAPPLTGPDSVPPELVGRWTTDDRRYHGRYLELTPDALILRASATEGTEYTVQRVQRHQIAQGFRYDITAYSERSGEYRLTLEYREAEHTFTVGGPDRGFWHRER